MSSTWRSSTTSASARALENRILEYVDHLHEHFLDPVVIRNGHYMPPTAPGYSITMRPELLDEYEFPVGKAWALEARRV